MDNPDTSSNKRGRNDGSQVNHEKDNDDYQDRHGNPATKVIFIDKLPPTITEKQLRALLAQFKIDNFEAIKLGNKVLQPGEFRTCTIHFLEIEHAVVARKALQGYQEPDWVAALVVNYGKPRRPFGSSQTPYAPSNIGLPFPYQPSFAGFPQVLLPGAARGGFGAYPSDRNGNPACHTLFVTNFYPSINEVTVGALFPRSKSVSLSKKDLGPGQLRTCYIRFDDVETAVSERLRMSGYTGGEQTEPLIIHFMKQNSGPVAQPIPAHNPSFALGVPSVPPPALPTLPTDNYSNFLSTLPEGYYDANGNPATIGLFIDRLPQEIQEYSVQAIFRGCPGLRGLKLGNKQLKPGEYRTCFLYFDSIDNAILTRNFYQGYSQPGWERALLINFATADKIPKQYLSNLRFGF